MAEFSKLNGYDVKDATARQQIADLSAQHTTDKTTIEASVTALDERIGGIEELGAISLDAESKAGDFSDAFTSYTTNATPFGYYDGDYEYCSFISVFDIGAIPKFYFLKASTNQIIIVTANTDEDTVSVTTVNIDKPVSVTYANEQLTIGE